MTQSAELMDLPPDERAHKRVGTVVAERWYLLDVLGAGGMATVYKAVHNRNGRKVALKVLHPELLHYEEVRERFMLEAFASNRVGHAGVVKALDDGLLDDGVPYLVMEYLDGESLEERWKGRGQLPTSLEVCHIAECLLEILEAAHARGVVHRDIKPENVFLTEDGELKLLDFGIAKTAGVERNQATQAGIAMGTPSFMSPEQARGRWEDVDARSDLFSVAATMYALISGRYPREAETTNEALLAAMTSSPQPIREVADHVHPLLAAIIDRGTAFEKTARFQSATEMREAVAEARLCIALADPQPGAFGEDAPRVVFPLVRRRSESPSHITYSAVVTGASTTILPAKKPLVSRSLMVVAAAAVVVGGFFAVKTASVRFALGSEAMAAESRLAAEAQVEHRPTSSAPDAKNKGSDVIEAPETHEGDGESSATPVLSPTPSTDDVTLAEGKAQPVVVVDEVPPPVSTEFPAPSDLLEAAPATSASVSSESKPKTSSVPRKVDTNPSAERQVEPPTPSVRDDPLARRR